MKNRIEMYRNAIEEALITVGQRYGLELKCESAGYGEENFTFKLIGTIKANTVDSQQAQKAAELDADVSMQKQVSYYVAECMEFPGLGEYHDYLTVEQAVEIYERIPSERRNAIKGIGITIQIQGQPDYTDRHFEIVYLNEINPSAIEYADEDRPLVLKAYQELLDCLKRRGIDYSINQGED